jgi:hypothetical protein
MATLDETNIFGLPLTRQYGLEPKPTPAPMSEQEQANRQEFESRIGSDNKFGLTYEGFLKAKEKKLVSDQRMQVAQALAEGDTDKAYEGFTELPMVTDQFPAYMTPVLGNIIDEKERRYFAEKAGRELKDPRDVELEMLMASDPRDVKQFTTQDPVSGAMSTLAGVSSLIGIGEGPTMLKAGIMGAFPSLRRGMVAKSMDGQGGGGGGISNIQPQPTKDYAGFVSSVERAALGPQRFGTGQDLIKYLESKSRSGISTKELEYIDFDQIRNNPDLSKEDVIKYIQANRPNLYRVERRETGFDYGKDGDDQDFNIEFNPDRTWNTEAELETANMYYDDAIYELENLATELEQIMPPSGEITKADFTQDMQTGLTDIIRSDTVRQQENFIQPTEEFPLFRVIGPDGTEVRPIYRHNLQNKEELDDGFQGYGKAMNVLESLLDQGNKIIPTVVDEYSQDAIKSSLSIMSNQKVGSDIAEGIQPQRLDGELYVGNDEQARSLTSNYELYGNETDGYTLKVNDEIVDENLSIDEARIQANEIARNDGDIRASAYESTSSEAPLKDELPFDVIEGNATLKTEYQDYSGYRLPMGGAENYREFTLHLDNPKTPTRYSSNKGDKHYGGGDEFLHYRTSDRTDVDGKKVLFVEEIQSDLHDTARSSRRSGNYELPKGTIEKTYADIEAIKPKDGKGLLAYNESVETEFEFTTPNGEVETLSPQQIVMIGKRLKGDNSYALTTPDGLYNYLDIGENKIKSFVDMYGKDNALKISNMLEPVIMSGTIPDFPYKGTDWVELAIKDIYKLAAEGDYDRVAFTNAPTQINRNQKRLNFITDIGLQRVPSIEEYEKSNQFKADLDKNLQTRFDDEKNLVDSEYKQIYKNNYPNKEAWFADHPGVKNDIELVTKSRWADQNTEGEFILTKKGLGNLQGDDVYKSTEQLLEMIKQNPDKQVGAMPIRGKNIDDLLKELNMPLGNVEKQIMADIKAGNIPSSVDDGQIYELNIKEGSGKKYLDLYGSKIPQQAESVAKKFDKGSKKFLNEILYETYRTDLEPYELFNYYDAILHLDPNDPQIEKMNVVPLKHKATTIDITEEMRKAILEEGVNVMYKGGIVNKVKSMDKPIQGNRREM